MDLMALLRKNRPYKDRHAGQRCFLVGNGPSLNQQDLRLLSAEVTIAANNFFHHPDLRIIAPEYWIAADPQYWEKPEGTLFPLLTALTQNGLPTKLFMPTGAAPKLQEVHHGLLIEPHFFHYDHGLTEVTDLDFCQPVPPFGQNVMVTALMLALYMGCNPIYMLGCDHSWWQWTAETYHQEQYERFFVGPTNTIQTLMPFEQLQETIRIQRRQYVTLLDYARARGIAIFNATQGGFLDTFPRAEYDSLFPREDGNSHTAQDIARSAVFALERGDFVGAEILLQQAKRANVGRLGWITGLDYLRAYCLARRGERDQALPVARQALSTEPSFHKEVERLIKALESGGPIAELSAFDPRGLVPARSASELASTVAQLNQQGEAYFAAGAFPDAARAFREALELLPEHAESHNNLGVTYWQRGQQSAALNHFECSLAARPADRDTVLNCASAYLALGKFDSLQSLCDRFLADHPGDREILGLRDRSLRSLASDASA